MGNTESEEAHGSHEITEPYVYQVAVKNSHKNNKNNKKECGLQKTPVDKLHVNVHGCEGDFNKYRTTHKKSTDDRALSIMTTQLLLTFESEGWPVSPGDLGENITIIGNITFEIGEIYSVGSVVLQITENIEPCNNLLHLPYVGRDKKAEFINMLKGRRGWYAKVLTEGVITPGDKIIQRQ